VISVKYDDANGVEQTFDPANYVLDSTEIPARLRLKATADWPTTSENPMAVRVRYVAGFGAAKDVPQDLKAAILLLVSQMYEHRTPEVVGTIVSPVQFSFKALVAPHSLNPGF
jgi:uncharacterized phiE125 gp8 family phage protein